MANHHWEDHNRYGLARLTLDRGASVEVDEEVPDVPVYCGLAATRQRLLCAVVDDAGRLLATQEVNDEAAGYGALCVLLTDRSDEDNCGHVPIATDSDTRLVPLLLAAAGRQLAVAEPELVERYARDEPAGAAEPLRRAVGMARALQAGTLTAGTHPAPRDLAGLRPILTAHTALAASRGAVASGLRQALRELYPAALRAFGDPTKPIALAVLDALPDPVMLSRGQDGDVVARIASSGRFDAAEAAEAVAALRAAASETAHNRSTADAVGVTVRQAVAAVRACDTALAALLREVAERVESRTKQQQAAASPPRTTPPQAAPPPVTAPPAPPAPRAPEPSPAAPVSAAPVSAAPVSATPVSAAPVSAAPVSGTPVSPAPVSGAPVSAASASGAPGSPAPVVDPPTSATPAAGGTVPGRSGRTPVAPQISQRTRPSVPLPPRARPAVSIPPIRPRQAPTRPGGPPPAPPGSVATAPSAGAPPESKVAAPHPPVPHTAPPAVAPPKPPTPAPATGPVPQMSPPPSTGAGAPPVSPTSGPPTPQAPVPPQAPTAGAPVAGPRAPAAPAGADTSDLELSMLSPDELPTHPNLRKPSPPAMEPNSPRTPAQDDHSQPVNGRASRLSQIPVRGGSDASPASAPTPPPTRPDPLTMAPSSVPTPASSPTTAPPVTPMPEPSSVLPPVDEADEGLLIFAQARSAWFQRYDEKSPQRDWASASDEGWRPAEKGAQPPVAARTASGLPKRVPQANLVPGSATPPPRREDAPPAVRDAATLAAHTAAYFRGWHRARPDEPRRESRTFQPSRASSQP